MNKEWRNMLITIGIFLIIVIWILWPADYEPTYETNKYKEIEDNFSNIKEFHWNRMPLTYSYGEGCVGQIIKRIESAFEIIENDTENLILFEEVDNEGNINFICYEEQERSASGLFSTEYLQGLATTDMLGNIINSSKIEFWSVTETTRPSSCWNFPSLELHEILHAFGFDHSSEEEIYSIMHPYGGGACVSRDTLVTRDGKTFKPEDKIDDEIVSCLKYIYSNGEVEGNCSEVNWIWEDVVYECEDGWYRVEGTEYCCPEPNMIISEEGYCE